jgi:leucyl-tRNA synthetase
MDYIKVHDKWKKFWQQNGTNKYDPKSKKPPYYCLEMFSYPSGASLHMGHYFNYAPSDTHARFKRMCGFNVFQPMGFDAFGLPAENHALKTNTQPRDNTLMNMQIMRGQLENLGGMYDWDYTLTTCFPDYYKWTQWLFLQLYKSELAYQKMAPVNWCDKCKTVLANEQVIGNQCERCDTVVERRNMKQWFIKITDYAEKLLDGIDGLDWPNKTKVMQKNWIGKSTGATVTFSLENKKTFDIFTTRVDTLAGVTFMAVAPEHEIAKTLITAEHKVACEKYIKETAKKSDIERQSTEKQKSGVFTGSYAINPLNNERVPIYLADYVLANYGTGIVMGVPAHDERDEDFAKKYKIEIRKVVDKEDEAAKQKIIETLGNKAKAATTYRLRDWSIGRQRYWGAPIPIIYCPEHGTVPVPEKDLPVELPYTKDFKPKGASPLAGVPEFINCKCPICGKPSTREADTMDTFVCSSWYFLRYPYAKRADVPFEKNVPVVDKYIGGAEHACMHLLYARFINMFLCEKGFINHREPFPALVHQGMILAPDGHKMSKSKGNTITPDKYVNEFGSDILRLYLMFGFKYTDGGPWDEATLKSIVRFVERVENAVKLCIDKKDAGGKGDAQNLLHAQAIAVKSVREDLESFSFNTAVARCMELLNAINDAKDVSKKDLCAVVKTLVLLLAPMLPHIAEELWEMMGGAPSIFDQAYPTVDEKHLSAATVEIAVQINSKIVGRITVKPTDSQAHIEKLCAEFVKGKSIQKVVFVKNRLINFIVSA